MKGIKQNPKTDFLDTFFSAVERFSAAVQESPIATRIAAAQSKIRSLDKKYAEIVTSLTENTDYGEFRRQSFSHYESSSDAVAWRDKSGNVYLAKFRDAYGARNYSVHLLNQEQSINAFTKRESIVFMDGKVQLLGGKAKAIYKAAVRLSDIPDQISFDIAGDLECNFDNLK